MVSKQAVQTTPEQVTLKRARLSKEHYGYIFVAPFFIIFFIFGIYPIIKSLELSFFKYDLRIPTDQFVGLTYYKRALADANFMASFFRTVKLWVLAYIFEFSFALVLSAIFTYKQLKWSHFFKSAFFVPNIISTVAISTLFLLLSAFPGGLFNLILNGIGVVDGPVKLLSSGFYLQLTCIYIAWWMWYGRSSIVAAAGMTTIAAELYDAARVDGASFFQVFFRITIPLIRPILTFMIFTSAIGGMQSFEIPYILTNSSIGGAGESLLTVAYYIFNQAFSIGNVGYSAALSVVLFVFICIFSLTIYFVINRKRED